jgi:phage baseplate assembly protein V
LSDFGLLTSLLFSRESGARVYGVAVGIVTNNKDPEGLGRVKVMYPWMSDDTESSWARVVTPMAGKERGLYLLPEVGDEVLVAFEHGAPDFACVLGGLWNGKDKPPESNANGTNDHRTLKSRSGHVIRLDDADGDEKIEILDKSGGNRIVIRTAANTIAIEARSEIAITAKGTVHVAGNSVRITSDANLTIKARGNIDVEAAGQLKLKGGTVDIN